MTKSFCHHATIPSDMMDIIEADLSKFDRLMEASRVRGQSGETSEVRNSLNAWIPTTYWVGGLIWHYFQRANDEFFHYDLDQIDGESMQYTKYELNQHYNWHQDEGIGALYKPQSKGHRDDELIIQDWVNKGCGKVRKLSAIVQLVDGDDYEGGATQIRDVDQSLYTVPRERGTIVFFDSRLQHRARTVRKGLRKSLIRYTQYCFKI